jgi:hypothetical protein
MEASKEFMAVISSQFHATSIASVSQHNQLHHHALSLVDRMILWTMDFRTLGKLLDSSR